VVTPILFSVTSLKKRKLYKKQNIIKELRCIFIMANKVGRPSSKTKKKENNNYDKLDNFIFHLYGLNSFLLSFAFFASTFLSFKLFFLFFKGHITPDFYFITDLFFLVFCSFVTGIMGKFSLDAHFNLFDVRMIYVREKHKKYWKKR